MRWRAGAGSSVSSGRTLGRAAPFNECALAAKAENKTADHANENNRCRDPDAAYGRYVERGFGVIREPVRDAVQSSRDPAADTRDPGAV
jgi:hypothetical protein